MVGTPRLHPFLDAIFHDLNIYIYTYMWQGPLGIIWTYPCLCGLAASISHHCCSFSGCSLSLSPSFCSSLWVLLWTHIVFGPHLFPYVPSLFSPSFILISLPIAILLSGCFGKNEFPGLLCFSNFSSFVQVSLLVSHLLCLSLLCVLWDETYCPLHSLSLRLDHMLHCLMI